MCIILFAYQAHSHYKLVVAANRDEFYRRPTQPAAFWDDYPQVVAGRDLVEMGTWMGVTTGGRFSALTNYRDPLLEGKKEFSRGELVKNFLVSEVDPTDYLNQVKDTRMHYNGFNLLVHDAEQMYYYSAQDNEIVALQPGIYGLSNAALNTAWPKVTRGTSWLDRILKEQGSNISAEAVFEILADHEKPDDTLLPDTGIGLEKERLVSSIYIDSPDYCTRSSSLLTIDQEGKVEFIERTYRKEQPFQDVHYSFQIKRG